MAWFTHNMVLQEGIWELSAHLGYFSGLAMLVPILGNSWEYNSQPWNFAPWGFVLAAGLVVGSIIILAWLVGSISRLFRSLGWMMVLPGLLALVFAASSQEAVYGWTQGTITGFSTVEPVVTWLVNHSVPKAAYLGAAYVLIGLSLLWASRMLTKVADFI